MKEHSRPSVNCFSCKLLSIICSPNGHCCHKRAPSVRLERPVCFTFAVNKLPQLLSKALNPWCMNCEGRMAFKRHTGMMSLVPPRLLQTDLERQESSVLVKTKGVSSPADGFECGFHNHTGQFTLLSSIC